MRGLKKVDTIEKIKIRIQPIFNANTMDISYGEVLLNIDNRIGTSRLIKYVNNNGLCEKLDRSILKRAVKLLSGMRQNIGLSMNLCERTLEKVGIYEEILETMESDDGIKERLVLEVNEYTNYENKVVEINIKKLRDNGVKLAMDDFGIGNSNIENLYKFKMDIIKFDKVYVGLDKSKLKQLKAFINCLHTMGMDTVIEGVETIKDLEFVKDAGYKNIQGFLLGMPVSVDEFRKLCRLKSYKGARGSGSR